MVESDLGLDECINKGPWTTAREVRIYTPEQTFLLIQIGDDPSNPINVSERRVGRGFIWRFMGDVVEDEYGLHIQDLVSDLRDPCTSERTRRLVFVEAAIRSKFSRREDFLALPTYQYRHVSPASSTKDAMEYKEKRVITKL